MPSWQATTWTKNTGHFVDTVQDMELWIFMMICVYQPQKHGQTPSQYPTTEPIGHMQNAEILSRDFHYLRKWHVWTQTYENIRQKTCVSSLCLHLLFFCCVGMPKQLPVESMFQLHCEIGCESLPQAVNTVATVLGTEGTRHQKHRS